MLTKFAELEDPEQAVTELCHALGVDAGGDVAARLERLAVKVGTTHSRERNSNADGWLAIGQALAAASTPED